MSVLLFILFCGVTAGAGYAASMLMHERRLFGVIAHVSTFGTALYIVLANALAHALPIRFAFIGTFIVFCVFLLCVSPSLRRFGRTLIDRPPRHVLWTVSGVLFVTGFACIRFAGSDPWAWLHFPLAASIAEGNFPIRELPNPDQFLSYHYGAALMAAAVHVITRMSVAVGFMLQPLIGAAGIVLYAVAFVRGAGRSWRASLLCGVLALGGTGLVWFKGIDFIIDLYRHFVAGPSLEVPFRNLVPTFSSPFTSSLLHTLGHRSFALGAPFFFGFLYCFQQVCERKNRRDTFALGFACVVFLLALALTMETTFVLIPIALACYVVLLAIFAGLRRNVDVSWKRTGIISGVIALIAVPVAFIQGGVLTTPGAGFGADAFRFTFDGRLYYSMEDASIALWDPVFIRDFGLPLVLLPFALFLLWKRRMHPSLWLLFILAAGHFLPPLIVRFETLPGDVRRLFFVMLGLCSILAGIWIEEVLLTNKKRKMRIAGWSCIAAMLFASAMYTGVRLIIPNFRNEPAPLIAGMPEASAEQHEMYLWVEEHTTLDDRFYQSVLPAGVTVPNETLVHWDRIRFMAYTGRFSIGPMYVWPYPEEWVRTVQRFEDTCDVTDARTLKIRYLIVENAERAERFANRCRSDDWVLRYGGSNEDEAYPRIYERAL